MGEVLVTPDVEAAAVTYLRGRLGSLTDKVATRVPATMPARMVRVSLTGGSRTSVASDQAQLTVECWAGSDVEASNLARVALAHMYAANGSAAGGVWVRRVALVGGVQFFPDPDTGASRYQFTVRWHVSPAVI